MIIPSIQQCLVLALLVLITAAPQSSQSSSSSSSSSSSASQKACQLIQEAFPEIVAFPGSTQFSGDIAHWSLSSEQNATCSVEPRSQAEVSSILKIVGRPDVRAPFAVKSGGHAYNLGQSSTSGIQISLNQFSNLSYNKAEGTVTIGVGLTWDKVYDMLEPLGVMVAGGRIPGIGVGGLSLGGGYSWKTNQFGLTIDTITAIDLVLPSGQAVHVTNSSYPELFFGLKGGLNNFGIVTQITYEAHEQTLIWGGTLSYNVSELDQVNNAIANFSLTNTDPKAQMIVSLASIANQFVMNIFPFYDAPDLPAGIFDDFLSIPTMIRDVQTRTFTNFLSSTFGTGDLGIGPFGIAQHVIPILNYTLPILEEIESQIMAFGKQLTDQSPDELIVVSIAPEPFFKPFSHSRGGAYPHSPSREVTPASTFIAYQANATTPLAEQTARHDFFVTELKKMCQNVQAKAVAENQSSWDDILYPNYALPDTPLNLIYGQNVAALQRIAQKYDPMRVMELTGGFHFNS